MATCMKPTSGISEGNTTVAAPVCVRLYVCDHVKTPGHTWGKKNLWIHATVRVHQSVPAARRGHDHLFWDNCSVKPRLVYMATVPLGIKMSWFWTNWKMINCAVISPLAEQHWPSPEQYVISSHIDRLWSCQAGSRNRGGVRHADMNKAILVFEILRHFLGLDYDSCDSRVLCDPSHSSKCGEDKHLKVNFWCEKWSEKKTGRNKHCFNESCIYNFLMVEGYLWRA